MDAARVRAFGAVHREEALYLTQDAVERTRLVAAIGLDDVAVHRIAAPHHRMAFTLRSTDKRGQPGCDLVMPETADKRAPPRLARGIERGEQPPHRLGPPARTALERKGGV